MVRINIKTGTVIEKQEFTGSNPERQLQEYVEKYLNDFFQAFYLKQFYKIPGGEIDTLAITEEGNPCIIEYKHRTDDKIINQIIFYYDWLQERSTKYEFERIVKENPATKDLIVDWSKIRLICVAQEYSKWDISLIKHLDTDIECYSYSYHQDELDLHLDPIINMNKNIRAIASSKSDTTKIITLEDHRNKADATGKELLDKFREEVLSIADDISEGYTPEYIKYVVNTTFLAIHIRKKWLILQLRVNEQTFMDEKGISTDISHRGWSVSREIKLEKIEDIPYVISLIKQAYEYQQ